VVVVVVPVVASGAVVAVGLPAGVTVSVFCSQAARRAAPARMQMYFFIVVVVRIVGQLWIRSKRPFRPYLRRFCAAILVVKVAART
jgi:hypothetical protein